MADQDNEQKTKSASGLSGLSGQAKSRWIQRFSGLGGRTLVMILVLLVAVAVIQRLDYRVDPDRRRALQY